VDQTAQLFRAKGSDTRYYSCCWGYSEGGKGIVEEGGIEGVEREDGCIKSSLSHTQVENILLDRYFSIDITWFFN